MPGWKRDAQTRQQRGYGKEWQRARDKALQRDKGLCQPCARLGRDTPAREVDHILPISKGGSNSIGNLQSICIPCHRAKTTEEGAEAQGRPLQPRVAFDPAGCPVWPDSR
jgi:5-methylcytosine-specific restriction enzyme A